MGVVEPVANMKKESKIYSYEDQKWEAELRQELQRKKRAESLETSCDARQLLKKAKLSQKMKVRGQHAVDSVNVCSCAVFVCGRKRLSPSWNTKKRSGVHYYRGERSCRRVWSCVRRWSSVVTWGGTCYSPTFLS